MNDDIFHDNPPPFLPKKKTHTHTSMFFNEQNVSRLLGTRKDAMKTTP